MMLTSCYIGEKLYNHKQTYEVDGELADALVKEKMAYVIRDNRA
jgi:hypothetical protein